jgi:hypothetical protein
MKEAVYAAYGIGEREPGEYEVDHLIPVELGGSNEFPNLWPEMEPDGSPGWREKDQVEVYLGKAVCARVITLSQARNLVATRWLDVYEWIQQGCPRADPR